MTYSDQDNTRLDLYDPEQALNPYGARTTSYGDQNPGTAPIPFNQMQPAVHTEQRTSTLAVLSAVCSTSTVVTGIGFLPGIVLGHMAVRDIDRTGDRGKGFATTGLIVGYSFLVLWVLVVIAVIALMFGLGMAVSDLVEHLDPANAWTLDH